MPQRLRQSPICQPPPAPTAVLRFAELVAAKVRRHRGEQLRLGQITQAKHDGDIALAKELLRWAQERLLGEAPLN